MGTVTTKLSRLEAFPEEIKPRLKAKLTEAGHRFTDDLATRCLLIEGPAERAGDIVFQVIYDYEEEVAA